MLYEHDMAVWHYLGYKIIKYGKEEQYVFLFCRKDNLDIRSFKIVGPDSNWCIKNHPYILRNIIPWTAGNDAFYFYARDDQSQWLNAYMLEHYKCVWDQETSWWEPEKTKYDQAVTKSQKKNTETPTTRGVKLTLVKSEKPILNGQQQNSTVVHVDFTKKKPK